MPYRYIIDVNNRGTGRAWIVSKKVIAGALAAVMLYSTAVDGWAQASLWEERKTARAR